MLQFFQFSGGGVNEDGETVMTLGDVLAFATGSTKIPVIGFEQERTITFDHDAPEGWKLTSNTCINTITFPINKVLPQFKSFSEEIIFCIRNTQGFGCL